MHSLNPHFKFLAVNVRPSYSRCMLFIYFWCKCLLKGAESFIDLIIFLWSVLIGMKINWWPLRICVHLLNCIGSWKILSDELNSGAAFHHTWNLHCEPFICDCSNLSWFVLIESYKWRSVANMSRVASVSLLLRSKCLIVFGDVCLHCKPPSRCLVQQIIT